MVDKEVLRSSTKLIDERYGVIKYLTITQSLPDEPTIYLTKPEREYPSQMTDGPPMPSSEGGCSLQKKEAIIAGIGEAVERYCACIYRTDELRTATYEELESALDPTRVTNFSPEQLRSNSIATTVCQQEDEIRWELAERLRDDSPVYVPAQLVYLSYDRGEEPLIRKPISTGLAAGTERFDAVVRGTLEIVERDAFMIYYLTKTPLPKIRIKKGTRAIRTLTDRLARAGIEWYLLDARTDAGVPIVIAILVDDECPTVTVSAAAHGTATGAVQDALEEALQVRMYQRDLLAGGESPINLENTDDDSISIDERVLGYAHESAADKLAFWLDSDRSTTLEDVASDDQKNQSNVMDTVQDTFDPHIVDLTTRDISQVGFYVVRVIAPEAQPLYLRESTPYLDTARLEKVPQIRGYNPTNSPQSTLNNYPHPFS